MAVERAELQYRIALRTLESSGRDETAADDPVLRQMFFGFANNDEQAVVPLLRALASSTSFAQRSETP